MANVFVVLMSQHGKHSERESGSLGALRGARFARREARTPGSLHKSLIPNVLGFFPSGKINENLKQENMQALAGVGRS